MDAGTSTEIYEIDEKYHPLIWQNTVHKQISDIIEKIDPQKKQTFLDILHDSFRSILSCFKCKSLLKENSFAFDCGHKYCDQCNLSLNKCIRCNSEGARLPIRNFSKLLDIIKEIKSDFNTDSVIYEMIRYLLFPNEVKNEPEAAESSAKFNTPPPVTKSTDTGLKKSRKVASNGRKLKMPATKSENSRKKLLFDKTNGSIDHTANGLENDSENLFIETTQARKWNDSKKMLSYLEQQPTISETSSAVKTKRKRNESDVTEQSVDKVKRAKKKKTDTDTSVDGEIKPRSSKRISNLKMKSEPCSPSDLQNQGEAKQQNVTVQETKINHMLDVMKSAVGEIAKSDLKIANAPASERDMDTEELDLNVWQRNDKNEKRKSLFKSLKEGNKKDVFISGTFDSFMDRYMLTPKLDLPKLKILNAQRPACEPKIDEKSLLNGKTKVDEKSEIGMDKHVQDVKKMDAQPSPGFLVVQRKSPRRMKSLEETSQPIGPDPMKVNAKPSPKLTEVQNPSPKSTEPAKESSSIIVVKSRKLLQYPKIDEKLKIDENLQTDEKQKKRNFPFVKQVVTRSTPGVLDIQRNSPRKIESPEKTSQLTVSRKKASPGSMKAQYEPTPKIIEIQELSPKSVELAKVNQSVIVLKLRKSPRSKTSPQKPQIESIEQTPTTSKSLIEEPRKSKLGLPLFPEINADIFSQTTSISSSTPYGVKKVVKTYSRAKSNLFNRSTSEISPIAEKEVSPVDLVPQSSVDFYTPSVPEDVQSVPPVYDSPVMTPVTETHLIQADVHALPSTPNSKTQLVVQAEVHENPVTPVPSIKSAAEKNRRDTSADKSMNKSTAMDEIITMDVEENIDKVIETVNKIAWEMLQSTKQQVQVEESQSPRNVEEEQRKARAIKVKKLQETINNKNEKSMLDLKKNFHVSPKLAVERVKNPFIQEQPKSPSPSLLDHGKTAYMTKSPKPVTSPKYSRAESPFNMDTISTQKRCTPSKSVACQTSPELHLALLKQEFPHLFELYHSKKDFPVSVYDTPVESTNEPTLAAKTPDASVLNASAKYTLISEVTSSEKKIANKHFADDSILCDSPFSIGSANKTTNVSGYAPLTPDRKMLSHKKLSCRLNFDDSPAKKVDDVETECVIVGDDSVESAQHAKKVNEPDRSKEIEFSDSVNDKMHEICDRVEQEEMCGSASILDNGNISHIEPPQATNTEDVDKTFFESESMAMTDTEEAMCNMEEVAGNISMREVVPDTEDIAADMNEDKVVTDDEDDVDFVAATPKTQPRRLFTNTLEKILTPCNLMKRPPDVSLNEFSICQNTTPTISFIQPLDDVSQYSVVKKPTAAELTPNADVERKEESDKISIELFNSAVSNSLSFESVHLTTSGLKDVDTKIIKNFCNKFSASYFDKLTDKTTHLVVKTDLKNRTARTFKYLQAIVSGIRIVSMRWIEECLSKDKIVNEEKYIPLDSSGECGPLRTFNVAKGVTPSPLTWLKDYSVYFTEPVPRECTLEQLQEIMRKAGATIVNSLNEFQKYFSHHRIIIVSDSEDDENEDALNMQTAGWLQTYQAVSLEFNWMLEVIGRNRLVPFADFEVVEIPNEYLLKLNFPPEMLQSDDEDQNSD